MVFRVLLCLLALIVSAAQAEDLTISWENPTTVEQCSTAGPYTDPGGTRIWQMVAELPDPAQTLTETTLTGLKPGTYNFVATSYTAAGEESRVTNKTEHTVTNFVVVDDRAYIVAKVNERFLLLVVGTVPLGTACDPSTEVNGYNSVPVDQVTFTGAQDVIVVAQCG